MNTPDLKLNFPGQVEGDLERRSGMYTLVHEHPSTGNDRTIDPAKQFNAVYANGGYGKITLGQVVNKGGAAGRIMEVIGQPEKVAKIFHSKAKSQTNREKLRSMLLNRPSFFPIKENSGETNNYIQIAWPEAILEDEQGFCAGYLMPKIDLSRAASLDHFMQKAVRQKLGLSEKYAHRLQVAYNLSAMVAALHHKEHYIVDLKPSNIYIYKDSMLVVMLDCDGFSINGNLTRYPAEFVSEEYIYPEGMSQNCDEMGEEQDKFALSVIIFKLLNNGIHPYSGTPRKSDAPALTIQERITKNHYAYGSWADLYQAPHPYSLHDYFDRKTLEMFDRAFYKGQTRPTAAEWLHHLHELIQNLRICKKNPNHAYFTSKGCGQCAMEEKFRANLEELQKQRQEPRTIRGMEIENLNPEKVEQEKIARQKRNIKTNYFTVGGIITYLLFWGGVYKMVEPAKESLNNVGIGPELVLITAIMYGLNKLANRLIPILPLFKNGILPLVLQLYTLLTMIIALIIINDIPPEFLLLDK